MLNERQFQLAGSRPYIASTSCWHIAVMGGGGEVVTAHKSADTVICIIIIIIIIIY